MRARPAKVGSSGTEPGLSGFPRAPLLTQRTERRSQHGQYPQSKKRARQNERRYQINKARRSRIRTYLRRVEEAIESGDQSAAKEALQAAQPELMRGVTKGLMHKNTASRKMSRLSNRVKSLS